MTQSADDAALIRNALRFVHVEPDHDKALAALDRLTARIAELEAVRREALEEAARIASNGCLVPPDGGSPTTAEADLCDEIARRIRSLIDAPQTNAGGAAQRGIEDRRKSS